MTMIGLGISQCFSNAVADPVPRPTITAPGSLDVSTFEIGTAHTISAGTATASGGGVISYEFRWQVNGADVAAVAGYTPQAADDGLGIVAQWRAVETGGTSPGETLWQTVGSGTVTYAAAVNTVAPVVSGSTGLGDTLSVANGTWTGAAGGAYTYQWQRGGVDISGETSTTYTIVLADDAASVRCVVTYTNSGGAVAANSNAVTVDDFAAPVITGVPTISGTAQVGETLTATAASVTGTPTPSRTWQWYGSTTGAISGATASTYVVQAAREGEQIYVIQTETNALGADTAQATSTATVTAAPVSPIITSFTAGPQSGTTIPFSLTLGNSEPTPMTLDIVAVPNGAATPSVAQVKAGQNNAGTNAEFWVDSYSFSGNLSAVTITPARDFTTEGVNPYDFYAVVTDNEGDESLISSDLNVSVTVNTVPAITGVPTISGTEQVGETLTATAATPVSGYPTPTRTWQWVNSVSGDISGATSSTYVLQASDEGDTITVRQIETNSEGNDTATSAATGAIAAAGGSFGRVAATEVIDYAGVGTTSLDSVSDGSGQFTAGGTADLLFIAVQYLHEGTFPTLTLSVGAQSAELIANENFQGFSPCTALFMIRSADIPAGANTVTLTASATVYNATVHITEYEGADQTTPVGTPAFSQAFSGTTQSMTVTLTAANSLTVFGCCWRNADVTPVSIDGSAVIYYSDGTATGTRQIADESVGASGSVTRAYTSTGDQRWQTFAIEIYPA